MIEEQDIERLREIFVTRAECQKNIDDMDESISENNVRLAVIENQLKLIIWILCAVGGGVITMLLKLFFEQ